MGSRAYPAWLRWLAVLAGTGSLFTGLTWFVGLQLVSDPVLFPAFALPASLSIAALGVAMWRHTSRPLVPQLTSGTHPPAPRP